MTLAGHAAVVGSYPGTPRTLRGAIVAVDPRSPLSRIVAFQYNPDNVVRDIRPRAADQHVGPADAHRVWGAPTEKITMTVEIDAADGLEVGDPVATGLGIGPQLAALEMLLYPSSALVITNTALLLAGTIEILPPEGPLTVLIWGTGRSVPVRLESLRITEQAFDTTLNPIRASVELAVHVLSYNDLPPTDAGYALFLVHQVKQEVLAGVAGLSTVASAMLAVSPGSAGS